MKSNPNIEQIIQRTSESSHIFYKQHITHKNAQNTFGYFTTHPVAPLNLRRLRMMLETIHAQSLKFSRPLRILDLACGGGIISNAIAQLGHIVFGLDSNLNEIQLGEKFAHQNQTPLHLHHTDFLQNQAWEEKALAHLKGSPDLVILAYALHHIDPSLVSFTLQRLHRFLEPGALLLINEENPTSPLFLLKHLLRSLIQKDTHLEFHQTYSKWVSLLENSGFHVQPFSFQGIDMLPSFLVPARLRWSILFIAQRI